MHGQPCQYTRPHVRLLSSFQCINAWINLQLKVALIHKLRGSLMWLTSFPDMLCMGVCTTRQWQTSGRLVQELNVSTVRLRRKCLTLTIQAPMSISAMTCLKPINFLIIDPLLRGRWHDTSFCCGNEHFPAVVFTLRYHCGSYLSLLPLFWKRVELTTVSDWRTSPLFRTCHHTMGKAIGKFSLMSTLIWQNLTLAIKISIPW